MQGLTPRATKASTNVSACASRLSPADGCDSGAFVYHEPDARASRICAIGESAVAAGLEGYAFARVAAPLATPAPRGYARASVTKTRVPRDTKTCQSPVDSLKCKAVFSTAQRRTSGKSQRNASPSLRIDDWSHARTRTFRPTGTHRTSDCGVVLFQSALQIAVTALSLFSSHVALAYVVVSQDWAIASRQEY